MKKRIPPLALMLILVVFAVVPERTLARENKFGAGVIIGEPTGLTVKYWVGAWTAVDAAVAWSFKNGGALYLHADYLFHFVSPVPRSSGEFSAYAGGGAFLAFRDDFSFGIRVPVGMSYRFEVPVEAFAEIAPGLLLVPETGFELGGGVGLRYYF
jgi:hypothetical protein